MNKNIILFMSLFVVISPDVWAGEDYDFDDRSLEIAREEHQQEVEHQREIERFRIAEMQCEELRSSITICCMCVLIPCLVSVSWDISRRLASDPFLTKME